MYTNHYDVEDVKKCQKKKSTKIAYSKFLLTVQIDGRQLEFIRRRDAQRNPNRRSRNQRMEGTSKAEWTEKQSFPPNPGFNHERS